MMYPTVRFGAVLTSMIFNLAVGRIVDVLPPDVRILDHLVPARERLARRR